MWNYQAAYHFSQDFLFLVTSHHCASRFNDSDQFKDPDLYSDKSDREGEQDHEESDPEGLEKSEESDSDTSERQDDSYIDLDPNENVRETPYLEQSHEELGEVGDLLKKASTDNIYFGLMALFGHVASILQ